MRKIRARVSSTQSNRGVIKAQVEVNFDELTDETIILNVINLNDLQGVISDEDYVHNAKNISWIQATHVLNTFIKFPQNSNSLNGAEIMKLHIIRNNVVLKKEKNGKDYCRTK